MRFALFLCSAVVLAQQTTTQKPATAGTTRPRTAASTAARSKPAAPPALTTDDQKTIYALGLSIAQSIQPFDLSPAEFAILQRGLADGIAGKPAEDLNEWGPKIRPLVEARGPRILAREKAAGDAFAAKVAAEPGAVKTDSGLVFRELVPGTGLSPKSTDTVKVNYRGTLVNGTEFDSSYKKGQPIQFALNGVIPCWTEGVQKMKVGGKAELVCPASIAYGDAGRPPVIPAGATLVFQIELLDIVAGAAPK